MVKGVIFDMDGLMFDTERLWDTFWAPCCEKLGLPAPPADFCPGCRGLAGENLRNHIHRYYPALLTRSACWMKCGPTAPHRWPRAFPANRGCANCSATWKPSECRGLLQVPARGI